MKPYVQWILAAPQSGQYLGVDIDEILKEYEIISKLDFDRQLTQKEKPKTKEDIIRMPLLFNMKGPQIKKTLIYINPETWHDKPVDAEILRAQYTTQDGRPHGEAVYIKNNTPEIDISSDIKDYYKTFNWLSRIYEINDKCDLNILEINAKLDEAIIKQLKHNLPFKNY
ncbi:MAG: hypothetical protein K0B02_02915 [DPANN group archaeon]|nr:hypothetical protein [DPANN group archaeon]